MLSINFVAHRGAASDFPENTLAAIRAAVDAGARFVEVDIQLSCDAVPVLFHDRDLMRLCQQQGAIHDYDFAALQSFHVSYEQRFADRFADNPLCSLQQLVAYLQTQPQVFCFVELKRLALQQHGQGKVLQTVLPLLDSIQHRCALISYDVDVIRRIKKQSGFQTGVVVDDWVETAGLSDIQPDWWFCDQRGLPAGDLSAIQQLVVFEVADEHMARQLVAQGVSYLETFKVIDLLRLFAHQ